jgi:hypothetical protein
MKSEKKSHNQLHLSDEEGIAVIKTKEIKHDSCG